MRIQFHLNDQWVTSLDEIAKSRETTRSAVIRTAIETHVLSHHLDHFRKLQLDMQEAAVKAEISRIVTESINEAKAAYVANTTTNTQEINNE